MFVFTVSDIFQLCVSASLRLKPFLPFLNQPVLFDGAGLGRGRIHWNSTQRMEREPYSKPEWGNFTFGLPASPAAAAATSNGV